MTRGVIVDAGREQVVVVHPPGIARSMLKNISDRLSRSVSESMDRVGRSFGFDTGLQTLAADHIDRTIEHVSDEIFHAGIIENCHNDCGIKIDRDVDIAVGAVVAPRNGAKQRSMGDALCPASPPRALSVFP